MYTSSLIVAALAACSANDDVPAPRVANVSPDRAMAGTVITIGGSSFCQQPPSDDGDEQDPLACDHVGTVQLGAATVSAIQYTDTAVTAAIPDLAPGTVAVRISVAGRISNAVTLMVE